MTDRIVLRLDGRWAIGADDLQWMILQRTSAKADTWRAVWFIRSHNQYLARGLRQKAGFSRERADQALASLPETFDQWKAASQPLPGQNADEAPAAPQAANNALQSP